MASEVTNEPGFLTRTHKREKIPLPAQHLPSGWNPAASKTAARHGGTAKDTLPAEDGGGRARVVTASFVPGKSANGKETVSRQPPVTRAVLADASAGEQTARHVKAASTGETIQPANYEAEVKSARESSAYSLHGVWYSKGGRLAMGVAEPFAGIGQILTSGARWLTSAGGYLPNALSRSIGSVEEGVNDAAARLERTQQVARDAAGLRKDQWDWWSITGNIASPANWVPVARALKGLSWASKALPAAYRWAANNMVTRGVAAGGIFGALKPTVPGADGSHLEERQNNTLHGMLWGGLLGPVFERVVAPIAQRVADAAQRAVRRVSGGKTQPDMQIAGLRAAAEKRITVTGEGENSRITIDLADVPQAQEPYIAEALKRHLASNPRKVIIKIKQEGSNEGEVLRVRRQQDMVNGPLTEAGYIWESRLIDDADPNFWVNTYFSPAEVKAGVKAAISRERAELEERSALAANNMSVVMSGNTVSVNCISPNIEGIARGFAEDSGKNLKLSFYTKDGGVHRTSIRGADAFAAIWNKFRTEGYSFNRIYGLWFSGDNLATFNKLIRAGRSPEQAARETFTGKMAGRQGYTVAHIDYDANITRRLNDGTFSRAIVYFERP
jgi:hypothetical protein